jgi:release factor glutamine methyltransferase
MTIGQLLADIQYGQKTILQKLIMHYCALTREEMRMQADFQIPENILEDIVVGYNKYVAEKMPLEYIVGKVTFLGNDFIVNGHTLIPRPETEYMIEAINDYIKSLEFGAQSLDMNILLDVGTGCGVLGLSVLLHNPDVFGQAILSDFSVDALGVAKKNYAVFHNRIENVAVDFVHGSLVEYTGDVGYKSQIVDKNIVLVANLPYIPDEMFDANVDETVKKWEPRMAFV